MSRPDTVFQSEHHPLVVQQPGSVEQLVRGLLHRKAYQTAQGEVRGLDVLEVGCNNGYGTRLLAQTARHVHAIDVAGRAIETARRDSAAPNVEYAVADGETLGFADGAFDRVVSFQVIEHVEDVDRYLAEIVRVLRPGGRALFTTPNGRLRVEPGHPPWNVFHVREYAPEELRQVLAARFARVRLLGLFGEGELQRTELQRIERSRRLGRSRLVLAAKRWLLTRASDATLWRIEAWMGRVSAWRHGGSVAGPLPDWDLDRLAYRDHGLDAALDLMAVCEKAGPAGSSS